MATQTERLRTVFEATGHAATASAFGQVAAAAKLLGVATAAGAGAVAGFGFAAVKTAADFETLNARLRGVMRSAAGGERAFEWAKKFAKETPYSLREVTDALTQMVALNLDPFNGMLSDIGDATAALGLGSEGFSRIVLQLGQMKAAGKATMADLRPLMQAGIPVLEIFREELGLTSEQLKKIGETGVGAEEAIDALMKGIRKRYGGSMKLQMDTIVGKWSNLKDAIQQMMATVGNTIAPKVKQALDLATRWLSDPKNVAVIVRAFAQAASIVYEVGDALVRKFASVAQWLSGSTFVKALRVFALTLESFVVGLKQIASLLVSAGSALVSAAARIGSWLAMLPGVHIGDPAAWQRTADAMEAVANGAWGDIGAMGRDLNAKWADVFNDKPLSQALGIDWERARKRGDEWANAALKPSPYAGQKPTMPRGSSAAPAPPPVKIEGGRELEAFAQRVWGTMWRAMLNDPQQRAYLKAAIAAGSL